MNKVKRRCPECGLNVTGKEEHFTNPAKCPKCGNKVMFIERDTINIADDSAIKSNPFLNLEQTVSKIKQKCLSIHKDIQTRFPNLSPKVLIGVLGCFGLLLAFFGIVFLFGVLVFLNSSSSATSIEDVLQKDVQASYNVKSVSQIVTNMRLIDTSDCPRDFRLAYERHIEAWNGLAGQISSEPQSAEQALIEGFIRGLAGDVTGGTNQMIQARRYWNQQIQSTYINVKDLAIKYGARIPAR